MKSDGQGTNSFGKTCPSHDCHGVPIRYPFWQPDNTTSEQFCGYRGFKITCSRIYDYPVIELQSDYYFVKNVDYDNHTLTLVDIDVVGQKCPRLSHNLSVGTLPLSPSTLDLNLMFYFNCTSDYRPPGVPIGCLASGSNMSYVRERGLGSEPEGFDGNWYDYCEDKLVAAVKDSGNGISGFVSEFGSAFNEGFFLDWRRLTDCVACEASDGRCGYNSVTKELCFCSDGTIKNKKQYCPAGQLPRPAQGPNTFSSQPPRSAQGPNTFSGRPSHAAQGPKTRKGKAKTLKAKLGLMMGIGIGAALSIIIIICLIYCIWKSSNTKNDKNVEAVIRRYGSSTPKRYTYSAIKSITNSFKDELGKGGYGNVFKGKLPDGRVVAVKVMKASRGNGEEFINEVASMGQTSHVNVVTLLGFCFEGKKRALIYEFMPNGSLEKFIYCKNLSVGGQHLGWERLYNIALGIARGLEYLHRGCNTRILHFDIKPQNILLDEDFCPKISDFGLAKLSTRKDSMVSMMEARGTIGFIAPEVFSRNFGGVSHKSDVYSYGMMVLEMVGGRKNVDAGSGHTSEIYFPSWIYNRIELNEELNLASAMTVEETEIARKMIIVGLWCIQTNPSQRPSISKVIEMLEGSIAALEIPPRPYLFSPPRSTSNS